MLLVRDLRTLTGEEKPAEMPRVSRRQRLEASPGDIWRVVSDPYHLPRWWPRTQRVENVTSGPRRAASGPRCWRRETGGACAPTIAASAPQRASATCSSSSWRGHPSTGSCARPAPRSDAARAGRHRVTMTAEQRLRGLSRLGGLMMRRAMGRTLSEALNGLERATGAGRRRRTADRAGRAQVVGAGGTPGGASRSPARRPPRSARSWAWSPGTARSRSPSKRSRCPRRGRSRAGEAGGRGPAAR